MKERIRMAKKITAILTVALMLISFASCGTAKTPANLTGEWEQSNKSDAGSYHIATITADTIEIYWYSADDNSKSLYWAGSYVAPTTPDEPYKWDSVNDKDKTGSSMLASSDETKTFTYQNGVISYEASALGTTKTIELKQK